MNLGQRGIDESWVRRGLVEMLEKRRDVEHEGIVVSRSETGEKKECCPLKKKKKVTRKKSSRMRKKRRGKSGWAIQSRWSLWLCG